ncbi:hypothetical protein M422DRAFT_42914 [Sphaerobolus stellatus SS14]|nr:hypothetical protein M422DRAFT_42914 [Sphaerobolus stellatus SS14]
MPRATINPEDRQHTFATEEIKQIAVYQRYTLSYKVSDIARNLRMSDRSVERVLQLWRTTGEVISEASEKKQTRKRIMTEQEQEHLLELVKSCPDLYLDELQKRLQEMFGLYIGISTIWDTLTDLGLTHKRAFFSFPKRLQNEMKKPTHNTAFELELNHQTGWYSLTRAASIAVLHIDFTVGLRRGVVLGLKRTLYVAQVIQSFLHSARKA